MLTDLTHAFGNALWIETRKAWRSRMPVATLLGFLLMPLVVAFFMVILKDPEAARRAGLISAKAQMIAGRADWPTFLAVFAQAIAVGGLFLFSLISTWVFGREFADGTVKEWLAVPVARGTLLLAKFLLVAGWSVGLTLLIYLVALLLGIGLQLPQASPSVILQGSLDIAVTTGLVVALMPPVALLAGIGRGYLLPVAVTLLFVLLANVLAVAGWGEYFPWAIPALYAGAGGAPTVLGPVSYGLIAATALGGLGATLLWWHTADQSR